ncbi:MAG: sulfotransferase [Pseudomonadota bacterium]
MAASSEVGVGSPAVKGDTRVDDMSAEVPDVPVAVLTYVNRSGSTFLASRLAASDGVIVTLESEAVGRTLLGDAPIPNVAALGRVFDELYSELKFRQWGIPRDTLAAALADRAFPLERPTLFYTILRSLPGGTDAKAFVYKFPSWEHGLPNLVRGHDFLRVIHVVRDPRAVYASQRKSISSRSGRPMVQDPITLAHRWKRALAVIDKMPAARTLNLRYEDLLVREHETVAHALAFLGIDSRPAGVATTGVCVDYAHRIPETQKHLHRKVGAAADASRIDSWRQELPSGEVQLLQFFGRKTMRRHGYDVDRTSGFGALLASVPAVCVALVRDIAIRTWRRIGPVAQQRKEYDSAG